MEFFERYKALIMTSLLLGILLLAMYNINIASSNDRVRETLIELSSMRKEEQAPPKEEKKDQPRPKKEQARELATHRARNENQENQKTLENRLEKIFEKNAAKQAESQFETTPVSGELALEGNQQQDKVQKKSEGNDSKEKVSVRSGYIRNSSISFSLVGRSATHIPNPIYTCDTPGKVVVNIEVNSAGEVIEATINQASSSSSNECLLGKALEYAGKARFTPLAGRSEQPGTITYYFQD